MPPKLSLPEIDNNVKHLTAEIRPEAVKSWLNNLSRKDSHQAARNFYDVLYSLNRSKVPTQLRLELMELYFEYSQSLIDTLETEFQHASLPLPKKPRAAFKQVEDLLVELAYGYKVAIVRLETKPIRLAITQQLTTAIYRALFLLGKTLSTRFGAYASPLPRTWAEIHQLYQFALERKIHEDNPIACLGTISQLYKHILLLAFCEPTSLMQGELRDIEEYITQYGHLTDLIKPHPAPHKDFLFSVIFNLDKGGQALGKSTLPEGTSDIFLQTSKLIEKLHGQIVQLEAGTSPRMVGLPEKVQSSDYLALLKRLEKCWSLSPKRQFQRTSSYSRVDVCVGLRAVWYFVNNEVPFKISSDQSNNGKQDNHTTSEWMVSNESAGGFSLMHVDRKFPAIHVGQLVGIKLTNGKVWNVGVVRRIASDNAEHMEIAIQIIAPRATPGGIKPLNATYAESWVPALLLPEITVLKQSESLITIPGFPAGEELFTYIIGTKLHQLQVTKQLEKTPYLSWVQFKAEVTV